MTGRRSIFRDGWWAETLGAPRNCIPKFTDFRWKSAADYTHLRNASKFAYFWKVRWWPLCSPWASWRPWTLCWAKTILASPKRSKLKRRNERNISGGRHIGACLLTSQQEYGRERKQVRIRGQKSDVDRERFFEKRPHRKPERFIDMSAQCSCDTRASCNIYPCCWNRSAGKTNVFGNCKRTVSIDVYIFIRLLIRRDPIRSDRVPSRKRRWRDVI